MATSIDGIIKLLQDAERCLDYAHCDLTRWTLRHKLSDDDDHQMARLTFDLYRAVIYIADLQDIIRGYTKYEGVKDGKAK